MKTVVLTVAASVLLLGCSGDPGSLLDSDAALDSLFVSAELIDPTVSEYYHWDVAVTAHNTSSRARTLDVSPCSFRVEVLDGPEGEAVWPAQSSCAAIGSIQHEIPAGDTLRVLAVSPSAGVQDSLAGGDYYLTVIWLWEDAEGELVHHTIDMGWYTLP